MVNEYVTVPFWEEFGSTQFDFDGRRPRQVIGQAVRASSSYFRTGCRIVKYVTSIAGRSESSYAGFDHA